MGGAGRVQPGGACIRITRAPHEYLGAMRCSVCDMTHERACVESCPTGVLTFGRVDRAGTIISLDTLRASLEK